MNDIQPTLESKTASIAVVFVNYNTSDQIIDCINTFDSNLVTSIVVVDNASPKDDPDGILIAHPNVNLIKSELNSGFGEGCNLGANWVVENTEADYIFFLNPDTLTEPGLFETLISKFTSPDIGAVAPRITMMGAGADLLWYGGGDMNWITGSARVPGCGLSAVSDTALDERFVSFASGCAIMMRRVVYQQCGGFDKRYFMYEEDVELSLRILSASYKILYVPSAVIRHLAQGSQGDAVKSVGMFKGINPKLPFFVYQTAKNRFLTVFTHGRWYQKCLFVIGFFLWTLRHSREWITYKRWDAYSALKRGIKDFIIQK